ncbi:MAG: apolipoprotein N-acyltransferase [Armatimonadetes bacterium]|nr:apolipoprotein N-acyltransferase [Armatimonadota bacterium]
MRLKESLTKAAPILLSAALFQLAFPPLRLGLLAFVGLAPWLASLKGLDGRQALKSGYCFGVLFGLGQMLWLQDLVAHWVGNWLMGLIPLVLASLFLACYFALFAWLAAKAWELEAPWMIPLLWAGVEVLRSFLPTVAFPWGLLATPLTPFPVLCQLAWFGSIYGASAWVAMANVLIARFLVGQPFVGLRAHLMAWIVLLATSIVRYGAPFEGTLTTVTVGQLGVDMAFGTPSERELGASQAVDALYLAASMQKATLLVLPEGLMETNGTWPPPKRFKLGDRPAVLLGGRRGKDPTYQSAFAYDGTWQYADKTRLVVFGEYVPLRGLLPIADAFQLPGGDLTPGDQVKTIEVAGIKVGALLCFEGLFSDIAQTHAAQGAQLLAQMSIDDWYMGTAAPDQLKDAATWRAIECGLPLVRSACLGYTLAVDQRGRVLSEAPLGKRVPLHAELKIPAKADLFPLARWSPPLFGLCLLLPFLGPFRRRLRQSD